MRQTISSLSLALSLIGTLAACSGGSNKLTLRGANLNNGNNNGNNLGSGLSCNNALQGTVNAVMPFNGVPIYEGQDVVFQFALSGGCADTYRILKNGQLIMSVPASSPVVSIKKVGGYNLNDFSPPGAGRDTFVIESIRNNLSTGSISVSTTFTVASRGNANGACTAALSPAQVSIPRNPVGGLAYGATTSLIVTGLNPMNGSPAPITVQQIIVGNVPANVPPHSATSPLQFSISSPLEGAIPVSVLVRDSNNTVSSCSTIFSVTGVPFSTASVDLRVSAVNGAPINGPIGFPPGGQMELHWNAVSAGNCVINPGAFQAVGPIGKWTLDIPAASTIYTLSCVGGDGVARTDTVDVRVAWADIKVAYPGLPPVNGSLTSKYAAPVNLSWTSSGVTNCDVTATGSNIAFSGLANTGVSTGGITNRTLVTLTCQVPGSAPVVDTVEIKPYWHQVDKDECTAYCSNLGKTNTPSPDGFRCMSGEARPASGIGIISQTYGCFGACSSVTPAASSESVRRFCYRPGQKRDNDRTDQTTGCHCPDA